MQNPRSHAFEQDFQVICTLKFGLGNDYEEVDVGIYKRIIFLAEGEITGV
jgi:hypothetical protein